MKKWMMVTLAILGIIVLVAAVLLSHPAFGRSPRGERLERIKKSPNYRDGEFHNRSTTPMITNGKSRWEVMVSFLTEKKPKYLIPDRPIETVKTDLSKLDLTADQLVWFGHSSYLLVLNGKKILVDPVLDVGFPASMMMKPFEGTDIYKPSDLPEIDLLVITHDHYDHLDYNTVKAIRERVNNVVCPLGVGGHLEYWGYEPDMITELDWGDSVKIKGFNITCLPSGHFSGRFLKTNPTLWASFMIEGIKTVYIGGDGGYDTHFKEIGNRFPHIDLALLEDGQYNQDWRYIHTIPTELPKVIHDLGAKKVQPVHNSKFALAKHSWSEPIDTINQTATRDSTIHLLGAIIGMPIGF